MIWIVSFWVLIVAAVIYGAFLDECTCPTCNQETP